MKKLEMLRKSVKTAEGEDIKISDIIALFTGDKYEVREYPLIGQMLIKNGKVEECGEPVQDNFVQIAYEWRGSASDGDLIRIYIGSKYTRGIYLQYNHHSGTSGKPEWCPAYAHGDCGKNFASGGTWGGSGRFDTLAEAIEARFGSESMPMVGTIPMRDHYYMESRSLHREISKRLKSL